MSKHLTPFTLIEGTTDLFSAQKSGLRCTAIRLKSGGLCLYSPVQPLTEAALSSLNALGAVTHVLAPNHYHHKGLRAFSEAFPKAKLCCSAKAKPRLCQQTGLAFESLESTPIALPDHIQLRTPDGLKTGEVWLQIKDADGFVWIVTDAFCGDKAPAGTFVNTPSLLGTFPRFGIANSETYRSWLLAEIAAAPPNLIVPCHGAMIAGEGIAAKTKALVEDRI